MALPRISVIIPALDEASHIDNCLRSLSGTLPGAEVLVVDGGSVDDTRTIAARRGATVLSSVCGRGTQCNAGGSAAGGEILLFLHADTTLPSEAGKTLESAFRDPVVKVAMFRLGFDDPHPLLRFYSLFSRIDSEWTKFGDQAIAVRSSFFKEIGGFPKWPLFEDVEFLRKARRRTRLRILEAPICTSARRFRADGVVRRQLIHGWLLLKFKLGASPHRLAREYGYGGTRGRPLSETDDPARSEPNRKH
jgi:rSAM/selenodomain-associated transferase 2